MNRIILSLDNLVPRKVLDIAELLSPYVAGFKFNDLLIESIDIIYATKWVNTKCLIMADPKLYDIPNTMSNSYRKYLEAGADIVTVHASASWDAQDEYKDNLCGVTVLTSFTDNDLLFSNINDTVKQLAKRCYDWGYGYLVCSPQDLDLISDIKIKKICPGVRPEWYTTSDDQKRTMTPSEAISKGADYLVIGRPILESNDMISAVKRINKEIEGL